MGLQEPNMTEKRSTAQRSRFMFNLVRNFQTNFQICCNILKSCQKGIRIVVVLNSYQHLVSSVLFMSDFVVYVQWYHCTFTWFSLIYDVAAAAKSLQSCLTLCDPIDGSPPGSPKPGILQARTLEWVAISFSNAWKWKWKWSHSVVSDSLWPHGPQPTRLLPVHGIFQARVLEWGAIAFSKVVVLLIRQ